MTLGMTTQLPDWTCIVVVTQALSRILENHRPLGCEDRLALFLIRFS